MIDWVDNGYRLSGTRIGWAQTKIRDGTRGLRKTWGNWCHFFFFRCPYFSIVVCPAIELSKCIIPLPTPIRSLLLTLFRVPVDSPLLYSLGHDSRLVIPSPVHTFAVLSPHIA
jgi:hypothetical protein